MLIEMMMGSVIILVALTAILSVVMSSAVVRRQNQELTLAYTAATNAIEELRTMDSGELLTRDGWDFDVPTLSGTSQGLNALADDSDQLCGELFVSVDSGSGANTVYLVTARVDWKGVRGKRKLVLETLIGERAE